MLLLTASSPAKSLLSPPFFSHHSPLYFSRFNVLASPPRRLTLLPHLRWVYFWLLMAAGFGLFISEEALNIWVGISLARRLTLDGTWLSFAESFTRNASYIASTVLWVYWGVCISDMVPFYIGKFFRTSGTTNDVCSKLGIGKEKAVSITRNVQKYGNLIGFVERFSLGVRNPTAFLAGALGISPEFFFAGVCCVGDWILIARASSFCCCNRGDRSGYMDFSPICCSGFNSIVLISPTALLQLIFLHDLVHSSRTRNCIKSILPNTQKLHKIDPAKHLTHIQG
uniref:Uncharacterized protein n=1 Tax=Daucus carota subsp. sativus TaxID=79200 RepID=A0A169WHU1_DAUCS